MPIIQFASYLSFSFVFFWLSKYLSMCHWVRPSVLLLAVRPILFYTISFQPAACLECCNTFSLRMIEKENVLSKGLAVWYYKDIFWIYWGKYVKRSSWLFKIWIYFRMERMEITAMVSHINIISYRLWYQFFGVCNKSSESPRILSKRYFSPWISETH